MVSAHRSGVRQWSVVSGQWSMVSGQLSMVNGQGSGSVVSGQWSPWFSLVVLPGTSVYSMALSGSP